MCDSICPVHCYHTNESAKGLNRKHFTILIIIICTTVIQWKKTERKKKNTKDSLNWENTFTLGSRGRWHMKIRRCVTNLQAKPQALIAMHHQHTYIIYIRVPLDIPMDDLWWTGVKKLQGFCSSQQYTNTLRPWEGSSVLKTKPMLSIYKFLTSFESSLVSGLTGQFTPVFLCQCGNVSHVSSKHGFRC